MHVRVYIYIIKYTTLQDAGTYNQIIIYQLIKLQMLDTVNIEANIMLNFV
jgi:hypothetical protein